MYVEVFETTASGQEPWFRVYYGPQDGVVDISEAPDKLRDTWERFGIPYKGKKVKPKDGELFLQAVARELNGSMTRSGNPVDADEDTIRGSI